MNKKMAYAIVACALMLPPGLHAEPPPGEIGLADDELLLDGAAIGEDTLSVQRGEGTMIEIDDVTTNQIDVDGSNHGNSVMNSVTGDNFISGAAFNGANGMFDTIQNSGNNVLIQNATIVNINLE